MRLDWSQIDTVLLDMDGTLLDLHYDNYFWHHYVPAAYARRNGIPVERARRELEPQFNEQQGQLQWYCVDYWSARLNLDIPRLKHEVRDKIAVRPTTLGFLRRLQRAEQEVRLVTNAHQKVVDLKMGHTGLQRYFDRIVTSHEIGAPKEQVRFWQSFSRQYPFDPKRTLFIDDSEPVLRAAQTFGISHLRAIRRPDSCAQPRDHRHFVAIDSFAEL